MLWKKETHQENAMYVDLFASELVSFESTSKIYDEYEFFCATANAMHGPFKTKNSAKALEFRELGNQMFLEKQWVDAMEWYNRSLCYAEDGSEMMAFAYANRASCFFQLKMYQKCLSDIALAIENNYPSDKKVKLRSRAERCLAELKKKEDKSDMYEPKLDFDPNEKFPCMANILKIEWNNQDGRHIVATADIDVGKTVMVDRNYFADSIKRYKRCNICLRSDTNLKPCKNCCFTMWCPNCEENDLHSIECDIHTTYFAGTGIISARIPVIRSILLAKDTFSNVDELIAEVEKMLENNTIEIPEALGEPKLNYRAFFKLYPNSLKKNKDKNLPHQIHFIYQLLMGQPDVAVFFHSEAHKRFLKHLIGHHLIVIKYSVQRYQVKSNSINFAGEHCDIDYEHRMSIQSSYFNHSCMPNAYLTSKNGATVCVVLRPIRKNEQVYVPYDIPILLASTQERQHFFKSKFNFRCKCERCNEPELEVTSLQINNIIRNDMEYHLICMADMAAVDAERMYGFSYNGARQYDDVERPKCFSLLKKYGTFDWCYEIYDIIYKLYSMTSVQERGLTKVPIFTNLKNKSLKY